MAEKNNTNQAQAPQKSSHSEREEKVLAYWKENKIFEKSLSKESPKGEFIFYDGPPFANGMPHYGHILAGVIKDIVPRWKTMQGYHVPRRWGWDCHGLPVENLIEKELDLKSKKDILDYGIEKFNEAAKESVMRYADEWRRIIPRLGRWVDMDNDYRTMDPTYTETVWWIFKSLHEKGLIYEGFKSMNICPRCETTLSNFEVAQGYKDITDLSVFVKFRAKTLGKKEALNTYFLAWTTTPWTLPGNTALAINREIDYVKIKTAGSRTRGNEAPQSEEVYLILAESRLSAALGDQKYELIETFKGSELVGSSYEPMFQYYSENEKLKHRENGWKVYAADFVTTEDGTGIVHIAPAFGSDDYDLSIKYKLPFVQHVSIDGKFKDEVKDFAGMGVKPKDTDEDKNAHQKTDIEIIKWLAHNGFLFDKEKLVHSYPHCWRCDTPLLNYATSSWFVKVTDLKKDLIKENNKIAWVPPEVGEARFGNWLEGARDWAISRSRFWGAPIPVWKEERKDEKEGEYHVIGSVEDLKEYSKAKNVYWVMRHGEAENNIKKVFSANPSFNHALTENGKKQAEKEGNELKKEKIDLILVSPLRRTRETADIVRKQMGLREDQVIVDERLHEIDMGAMDGRISDEINKSLGSADRFKTAPEKGENYAEVKRRMGAFLYDLESKYSGKRILIVTHETPMRLLLAAAKGLNKGQFWAEVKKNGFAIPNASAVALDFYPIPHNRDFELDLHRPYIDEFEMKTKEGHRLVRVADVFDCWFESGSMPYGQQHYPFENLDKFDPRSGPLKRSKGYPADFIAEGVDQTRGWFYSMLVLGTALFGKSPYKMVIVNGLVLAEDGQKMSKRKNNYPDPMYLVQKYGADALRFYMITSPVVHGQDLRFSEKGVDEITKKIVNRLLNVASFHEMYGGKDIEGRGDSGNILDRWILSRLGQLVEEVTSGLQSGELDRASRPFLDFTDDLSTWYLRRSRDRFKGSDEKDKSQALDTLSFVLLQSMKVLAPFMPFLAEEIYRGAGGKMESVHLESWPEKGKADEKLLASMEMARRIASLGLEARMSAKINVRQPLRSLKVRSEALKGKGAEELVEIIKDEVNVKEIILDPQAPEEASLDLNITPDLKEEGEMRELLRKIQDLRKEHSLSVGDRASLVIPVDLKPLVEKHAEEIKKSTNISSIEYGQGFELKAS